MYTVTNASGIIEDANVTNIEVHCVEPRWPPSRPESRAVTERRNTTSRTMTAGRPGRRRPPRRHRRNIGRLPPSSRGQPQCDNARRKPTSVRQPWEQQHQESRFSETDALSQANFGETQT